MLGTTKYCAANGATGIAGNVFQQNAGNVCQASAGSHGGGAGEGGSDRQPAAVFTDGEPTTRPATESADIRNRVGADVCARSKDGTEDGNYRRERCSARRSGRHRVVFPGVQGRSAACQAVHATDDIFDEAGSASVEAE